MNRFLLLPLAGLMTLSCLTLDSFMFDPRKSDEYLEYFHENWHVRGDVIPDSLVEAAVLTSSGGNRIYGFMARQPTRTRNQDSIVTVLYCHGRSEYINRYWGRVEYLWELGFNVFIFDYQGYGKSEGSPSGEACYADTRAALEFCQTHEAVNPDLIVYYGWSLGSFMATYLAADSVRPLGLILEAPMASVSAVVREGALLDIPGSFVADLDFDNETRIGRVKTRTLIVYGTDDETAVPERNAEVLIEKGRAWTDMTVVKVESAAHDDIPEVMGAEYYNMVRDFVDGCLHPGP
jgi:pimeloyl-ACP methyl ester carboxylesterase